MYIEDRGVIFDATGRPPAERIAFFTSLCTLSSGVVLSGFQLGSGKHAIKVRAYAPDGSTQPLDALWQPSGYMRNVVETVNLEVA